MRQLTISGSTLMFLLGAAVISSHAAVTIYTDKTAWENALGGAFLTEDFNDAPLNEGISFVSTESGHINPAEDCYQDVLASQSQNEPMTTWSFTPQVFAYGGQWTLGGPGGSGNSLLVYIADSSLYVGSISNSYGGGFWGFISDTPFTSVRLIGGGGTNQQNYRLDDMVYASPSDAPIPGDYNEDGYVDLSDYTVWADHFEMTGEEVPGDGNGDGVVDLSDYTVWADHFHEGTPPEN